MKTLPLTLIIALTSLFSLKSEAAPAECSDMYKVIGSYRFHRFADSGNMCWMNASPSNIVDLVYRSLLFTSEGTFLIFNSIDEDAYGVSDGARTYMLFPRNFTPTVEDKNGVSYFKSATAGVELILDSKSAAVLGMVGGTVSYDPKVTPFNKGGIELTQVKALVLDGGWKNYGDPLASPQGKSKFTDPDGRSCEISNSEVFQYASNGENTFRFTDAELVKFLTTRCPSLRPGF